MTLHDKFGRQITDLRISVTDRCNFRCVYAVPPTGKLPRARQILSWDELGRLARVFANLGIQKMRITGGEPLVRDGAEGYIRKLHELGVPDISMTTTGHLLAQRLPSLTAAGLHRINISLDSLDPIKFEKITRTPHLRLRHARNDACSPAARPAKITPFSSAASTKRSGSLRSLCPRSRRNHALHRIHAPRCDRHWSRELMFPRRVFARIHAQMAAVQIPHAKSETARKYKLRTAHPAKLA